MKSPIADFGATMGKCPICETTRIESIPECDCGYSFIENEITDASKLRIFFLKIEKTDWTDKVSLVQKIHQTQVKKHRAAVPGSRGGWAYKNTGKLLKKKKSLVEEDINLAIALNEYPRLSECRNKTQAKQMLKQERKKNTFFSILHKQFDDERDLQKCLIDNWERTPFCNEWIFVNSKYYLAGVGEIDILARHRDNGSWLVIELKKNIAEEKTVGQIQRYMGGVKENLACKNEEVFGCIISGYPPDEKIRLALLTNKNIEQQIYCLENDQIKFMDKQTVLSLLEFDKLPPEKQLEIIKK